jgi:hypothetical protein
MMMQYVFIISSRFFIIIKYLKNINIENREENLSNLIITIGRIVSILLLLYQER